MGPLRRPHRLGAIARRSGHASVVDRDDLDREALSDVRSEATAKVIRKAMRREPTIDWLLENQDKVTHYFHDLGVKGEL
jgi:hypothetical protein